MKIKAVFFDMFNTLADPHVYLEYTESQVIGMDRSEWSSYVWREDIARDRGIGIIKTEDELMDRICEILPFSLSVEQKEAVKAAHRERQRKCMTEIREDIVRTVKALKEKGFLLGVISNADVTDCPAWNESPLYPYFDDAIFSCDVGMVKPDRNIYELALSRLGVDPEEAVFVGDGGSDEHMGAKALGFTTIWTEHLTEWWGDKKEEIAKYADYHIKEFSEIEEIIRDLVLSEALVSDIDFYLAKHRFDEDAIQSPAFKKGSVANSPIPHYGRKSESKKTGQYSPVGFAEFGFMRLDVDAEDMEDIEDIIKNKEDSFQKHLFRIIDRKGLEDTQVYKRANIDRRHFSKIRSNENYKPSKSTAAALAIALELNLDETLDLLGRASITLSGSDPFDMIIRYCIDNRIYNIIEVNFILERFGQPLLGA